MNISRLRVIVIQQRVVVGEKIRRWMRRDNRRAKFEIVSQGRDLKKKYNIYIYI